MGWWPHLFVFDDDLVMSGGTQTNSDVVRKAICLPGCAIGEGWQFSKYHAHDNCACEGERVVVWADNEGWEGKACREHGIYKGPWFPYGNDWGWDKSKHTPPPERIWLDPSRFSRERWDSEWKKMSESDRSDP
jgi:hypothetical protein